MSRKSKAEYIGEKRRAYESAKPARRSRILDEVCETVGYTRKYVIKSPLSRKIWDKGVGVLRLDCLDLEDDLRRPEAEWSDYCNFFRTTKMIVAKVKKPDGKGHVRKCQECGPRIPYRQVLESGILGESGSEALRRRYEGMNGVLLYQQIVHSTG